MVTRRNYAFKELDDIANGPTQGRWSVDRVKTLKTAIRLAIKHCKEDLLQEIDNLKETP